MPLGSERADVQLVDHPACDRSAVPVAVGPGVGRGLPQLRTFVHAVGLAGRPRIRQHPRVVVEHEPVARVRVAASTSARHQPSSDRAIGYSVPSTSSRTSLRAGGAHTANVSHRARSSSATGNSANSSTADNVGRRPAGRSIRSVHCPAGSGRTVSPQPVSARPHRLPGDRHQHVLAAEERHNVLGGRPGGQHGRVAAVGKGAGGSRRSRSAAAVTPHLGVARAQRLAGAPHSRPAAGCPGSTRLSSHNSVP